MALSFLKPCSGCWNRVRSGEECSFLVETHPLRIGTVCDRWISKVETVIPRIQVTARSSNVFLHIAESRLGFGYTNILTCTLFVYRPLVICCRCCSSSDFANTSCPNTMPPEDSRSASASLFCIFHFLRACIRSYSKKLSSPQWLRTLLHQSINFRLTRNIVMKFADPDVYLHAETWRRSSVYLSTSLLCDISSRSSYSQVCYAFLQPFVQIRAQKRLRSVNTNR